MSFSQDDMFVLLRDAGWSVPDLSRTIRSHRTARSIREFPSREPCLSREPQNRIRCVQTFLSGVRDIIDEERLYAASKDEANCKMVITNDAGEISIDFDVFVNRKIRYAQPGFVVTIKNTKHKPFSASTVKSWYEALHTKIAASSNATSVYIAAPTVDDIIRVLYEVMPEFLKHGGLDTVYLDVKSFADGISYQSRFIISPTGEPLPVHAPAEAVPEYGVSKGRSAWHRQGGRKKVRKS